MKETLNIREPSPPDDRSQRVADRFKFRRVNEITGTFVLVIIAVLIAAVVWTGHSQRWFKSRVTLQIVLPEAGAAGIRQGSEVYFLGTLVGTVSDVVVDETGRMEAEANIRRDFFRFVRADSSAVVKRTFGLAGDSYFEITRGQGQPLPEKNASIDCRELPDTMETAIEQVRSAALPVMKKLSVGLDTWTALGTNLVATQEQLGELIGRLNDVVAGVEQGKGTVGKLIADPALADEVQALLARANKMMGELQDVTTNLNLAVKNIQNGTTRLPEITGAVADGTKDLPGLVRQTQSSMRELERLVEAMQKTWLLRKYVNQTNPPPLNPLSEPVSPSEEPVNVSHSPRDSAR
ncbi:MAG: MlaD family protein [Verrucomicrobiota bacterium]|jgi:phospholipid/cholesterol/gamma-HCH transport system substrate-binding protein